MNTEQPCEKYMTKVGFLMLACAAFPHKALQYAEKIGKEHADHAGLQKSCKLFVEYATRWRSGDEEISVKHLGFAAKSMSHHFGDQFVRAMGLYLKMMIALMEEGSPEPTLVTSPDGT